MARLTRAQSSANDAIIAALGAAGWQTTGRGTAFGVADLRYENGSMSLYVGYRYRSATIGLRLTETRSGKAVRLSIEFGKKLDELLRVITSWQARLSSQNWRDMVEDIVHVCPETFLIEGIYGEVRTKVEPSEPSKRK